MYTSHTLRLLISVLILSAALPGFSQTSILTGVVKDKNTHQDLKSVNVFIKETRVGTSTDLAGHFELRVPVDRMDELTVVFRHIAYFEKQVPVSTLLEKDRVYLQPRVIPLNTVEIEEEGVRKLDIDKDLPQTVSVIESEEFEIRGYVDAGDLLRIDNSVQIDEELSGTKTISIRGGNPDEVVVMFNGVKMNNAYNNIFDISLIDLENIERFELIKGSNTALYGPEAFSGVVNIVPKVEQDYNIRFQQRVGTYRSGNWGLHLYNRFDRLYGSYSIKRGGLTREFIDNNGDLENTSLHHTATLNYDLGANPIGRPQGTLSAMWIYTSLDFQQQRRGEQQFDNFTDEINDFNNLFSLRYNGALFGTEGFDLSASYKYLDQDQLFTDNITGAQPREILDRALLLNLQKQFQVNELDILFAYQFQNNTLDETNEVRRQDLERLHHGLVSIAKYHGETGSEFFQTMDVNVSVRHDRIMDRQQGLEFFGDLGDGDPEFGLFEDNDWDATNFKLSLNLSGYRENLTVNSYLNFGANTKFPTLFQQTAPADVSAREATAPNLEPEKNRSMEFGIELGKDTREHGSIYGWQVSGAYFQNHYDNKFREFFRNPGDPVPAYDNIKNAKINGFEGKATVYLFKKKISAEAAFSKYFLSEKSAFPFKSDTKRSLTLNVDHAGYSLQLFWFHEGEQVGILRNSGSQSFTDEIPLPSSTNLDVHLSKAFEISRLKLFANASGRNLLNDDDIVLEGLALNDRRFYLTVGVQY